MTDSGPAPAQPPSWPPGAAQSATPPQRTRRLVLVAAAAAVTMVIGAAIGFAVARQTANHAGPLSGASAAPAPTNAAAAQARALYQQVVNATRRSAGFHYVAVSAGPASQKIVGDAGQDGGRQVITVNSTYGAEQFSLVLVGGTVYFQGNAAALQDQLGVPAATSTNLQSTWVSVSSGDGPFSVVAPGITAADQAQEMVLVPTSTARVMVAGVAATRIVGTIPAQQSAPPGTGHLDATAASHLPMVYQSKTTIAGVAVTGTTTFTGWGTAPSVSAPSGAVVWSTLGASPPPNGYGSGGASPAGSPTPQGT